MAPPLKSLTTLATPQLSSVAVGLNSVPTAVYVHVPESESFAWLPTQVMVGSSLSVTTTSKLHVAVLPELSVIVHSTVVVPSGKTAPAKVAPPLKSLTTLATPQLSPVAVGSNSVPTTV